MLPCEWECSAAPYCLHVMSSFQHDPCLGLGGINAQTPYLSVVIFLPQSAEHFELLAHLNGQ